MILFEIVAVTVTSMSRRGRTRVPKTRDVSWRLSYLGLWVAFCRSFLSHTTNRAPMNGLMHGNGSDLGDSAMSFGISR